MGFRCACCVPEAFLFCVIFWSVNILLTAEVFVNVPVKSIAQAYTYRVPETLAFLAQGWRVLVPFGGRRVEGFVLSVAAHMEAAPSDYKL